MDNRCATTLLGLSGLGISGVGLYALYNQKNSPIDFYSINLDNYKNALTYTSVVVAGLTITYSVYLNKDLVLGSPKLLTH